MQCPFLLQCHHQRVFRFTKPTVAKAEDGFRLWLRTIKHNQIASVHPAIVVRSDVLPHRQPDSLALSVTRDVGAIISWQILLTFAAAADYCSDLAAAGMIGSPLQKALAIVVDERLRVRTPPFDSHADCLVQAVEQLRRPHRLKALVVWHPQCEDDCMQRSNNRLRVLGVTLNVSGVVRVRATTDDTAAATVTITITNANATTTTHATATDTDTDAATARRQKRRWRSQSGTGERCRRSECGPQRG
jgi:hypothetical protein